MKKALFLACAAVSTLSPTFAFAANTECQINKYNTYIDALFSGIRT
ncbi:hypothetical protein JCM19236_733 [Vibrio sp. JCM 19236]|nr:hypothetical protein JCM19236_733 [Vibrio sp. JCM 19236]